MRRLHAELGLRIWVEDAMNEVATSLLGPEKAGCVPPQSSGGLAMASVLGAQRIK